jgi:excisionase family DNA binding protein
VVPVLLSEPLLLRIDDASAAIAMSRNATYALIREGRLETVKVGRSRRVLYASVQAFVEELRAEAQGGAA